MERLKVERPIFRHFKISNIEITKDELFDFFFSFSYFLKFFEHSRYMIIFHIKNFWSFEFSKLSNFKNLQIFEIVREIGLFSKLGTFRIFEMGNV